MRSCTTAATVTAVALAALAVSGCGSDATDDSASSSTATKPTRGFVQTQSASNGCVTKPENTCYVAENVAIATSERDGVTRLFKITVDKSKKNFRGPDPADLCRLIPDDPVKVGTNGDFGFHSAQEVGIRADGDVTGNLGDSLMAVTITSGCGDFNDLKLAAYYPDDPIYVKHFYNGPGCPFRGSCTAYASPKVRMYVQEVDGRKKIRRIDVKQPEGPCLIQDDVGGYGVDVHSNGTFTVSAMSADPPFHDGFATGKIDDSGKSATVTINSDDCGTLDDLQLLQEQS